KSLSSPFSADAKEAFYAYAESQSVIEYMASSFGKNKINDLLTRLNDGYSMDDALMKVYGFNLDGLDKGWMDWLMAQPDKKTSFAPSITPGIGEIFTHPVYATAAG
ncbi:MAG: peptidase MA family metallohydrolase, partial [Chloroflexi bacterium]|nr:peptidase MA family metallohydrolase [Chloroflexota bacterium]